MKKLFTFLLTAILILSLSVLLFSCTEEETEGTTGTTASTEPEEPPHTHEFASEWTADQNGHYHACTCHPDVKNIVSHTDSVDRDGVCDVCFYVIEEPTTFTVTVVSADGTPIKGVKIKIYDSAFTKIVTTNENGQASVSTVYADSLKALVQSAPDGYKDIVDEIYTFTATELVITTQQNS